MERGILFIGDLHLNEWSDFSKPQKIDELGGIILNSRLFEQYKVLEQIIRVVLEKKPHKIIFLGDIFHRFTPQTVFVFQKVIKFLQSITDEIIIVCGNHDFIDEVRGITFLDYLNNSKIKIVKKYSVDDEYGYLAYIRDEEVLNGLLNLFLQKGVKVLITHNEIKDFVLGSIVYKKGMNIELLKRFDYVFNGHYHYPSTLDNILNVGGIMDFSFVDADNPQKGVFYFDGESINFYPLVYKRFLKVKSVDEAKKFSAYAYVKVDVEVDKVKEVENVENIKISYKPVKKEVRKISLEEILKAYAKKYKNPELAERVVMEFLSKV